MAIRPIVKYPDSRLREPTKVVGELSSDERSQLKRFVSDMTDTMYAANGAGLAAIQVGDHRKLFIVEATIAGGNEGDAPKVFIDPEIVSLSEEAETTEEGCLSFPGIYIDVKRSLKATVRATDLEGARFEIAAEGLYARALQHEYDHLTGRLLVDFAGPLKKKMIKRKMEKAARLEAEEGESGSYGDESDEERAF